MHIYTFFWKTHAANSCWHLAGPPAPKLMPAPTMLGKRERETGKEKKKERQREGAHISYMFFVAENFTQGRKFTPQPWDFPDSH